MGSHPSFLENATTAAPFAARRHENALYPRKKESRQSFLENATTVAQFVVRQHENALYPGRKKPAVKIQEAVASGVVLEALEVATLESHKKKRVDLVADSVADLEPQVKVAMKEDVVDSVEAVAEDAVAVVVE